MPGPDFEKHQRTGTTTSGETANEGSASDSSVSRSAVEQSKEVNLLGMHFNQKSMDEAKEEFKKENGHEAAESADLTTLRSNMSHEKSVRRQMDVKGPNRKDSGWRKPHAGEAEQTREERGLHGLKKHETEAVLLKKAGPHGDAAVLSDSVVQEKLGPEGLTHTGQTNVLHAGYDSSAMVSMKNGGTISADARAQANLVDFKHQVDWETPFHVFGEEALIHAFVSAEGMVGIEATAHLEAALDRKKETKEVPVDPKKGLRDLDTTGADAGAGVFAGARLRVGVGLGLEWLRKAPKAYSADFNKVWNELLHSMEKHDPHAVEILRKLPMSQVADWVMELLVGEAGPAPLAGVTVAGEASAGAGASAQARIGMKGGRLKFMADAGVTWGVGGGVKVMVDLDVTKGVAFGLLVAGEALQSLRHELTEEAVQRLLDGIKDASTFVGKKVHDGLTAVKDGAVAAGQAIGHGAAVAGQAIGHGASVAGQAIGHGASVAGHAISNGARDLMSGVGGLWDRAMGN